MSYRVGVVGGGWGAGLAKYRWVCNKPGLLLTGEWNLRHREDLHIYRIR